MQIIILGAPGVGKGTQAKILSSKLNIPHISTGDILRAAIRKKTELGLKAKEIVDKGELVPDDLMGKIIRETLFDDKCKNGYILDGFPRTIAQAKIMDNILAELDKGSPILLLLGADKDVIITRLSKRRACKICGHIVNLDNLEDQNKCPNCGAENSFYKRDDDDEDVIKNRLKVFKESTAPVIDYYKDKAQVIEIDATQSVEEVTEEICEKTSGC